jgi:hypothetical protein
MNHSTRARGRRITLFTVIFYGLKIFGCKTAQFCATQRESKWLKHLASATLRKLVKTRAKTRS